MSLPEIRKRLDVKFIVILFVVAFLIRLGYLLQIRHDRLFYPARGTDMFRYDRIASDIASGKILSGTTAESPLYPYVVLPAIYLLAGADVFAARVIQAALACLTVILIYLLTQRLFGRRAGVIAGAIAAIYAPFVIYDCELLSEWLLNLLCVASVLYLVHLRRGEKFTPRQMLLCGVLIGAACATKPTILAFLPFACLWLAGGCRVRKESWVKPCLYIALGVALVILPFVLRSYIVSGELVPVRGNSGIMFLMGNNPTATGAFAYPTGETGRKFRMLTQGKSQAEADRIAFRLAFQFIRENPAQFLRLWFRKLLMFLSPEEIGNNISVRYFRDASFLRLPVFLSFGMVLPLVVAGMVLALRQLRRMWLLPAFVLIQMLVIVSFIVVGRYRLVVVPFLIVLGGAAADRIIAMFESKKFRLAGAACAAVVALMIAINSRELYRSLYPFAMKLVGRKCTVEDRVYCFSIGADSGKPTPYSILLSRNGEMVRKRIFVPPEYLSNCSGASLAILCSFSRDARWLCKVNGNPIPSPAGAPEHMAWLRIPFPVRLLKPGENTVTITLTSGRMRIALDDFFDFDRTSVYSPDEGWRTDRLDTRSCLTFRSLHIADGEAVIRFELKKGSLAPRQK